MAAPAEFYIALTLDEISLRINEINIT